MVDIHGKLKFAYINDECNDCENIIKKYGVNIEVRCVNDNDEQYEQYELEIINCFTNNNLFKIPIRSGTFRKSTQKP